MDSNLSIPLYSANPKSNLFCASPLSPVKKRISIFHSSFCLTVIVFNGFSAVEKFKCLYSFFPFKSFNSCSFALSFKSCSSRLTTSLFSQIFTCIVYEIICPRYAHKFLRRVLFVLTILLCALIFIAYFIISSNFLCISAAAKHLLSLQLSESKLVRGLKLSISIKIESTFFTIIVKPFIEAIDSLVSYLVIVSLSDFPKSLYFCISALQSNPQF